MAWPLWPKTSVKFHDTPHGILTESGVWYRTTVELLNEYAAELFEIEPLEKHLAYSDTWIRSPHTLSVWLLALGVVMYNPWQSLAVVAFIFLGWQIVAPALVSRSLSPLLRILDAVLLQAILYAALMSMLAMSGKFQSLAAGLLGFICLRWGILTYLMRPLVSRCWRKMFKLPIPDYILRAFIIRGALKKGVVLADFEGIEQRISQYFLKKGRST